MGYRNIAYYLLYGLLAAGLFLKVSGWLAGLDGYLYHRIAEGMILAYLLLDIKAVYRRFIPGRRMLQAAANEQVLHRAEVKTGWLWVSVIIRMILFFLLISLSVISFVNLQVYSLALFLFYFAGIPFIGIIYNISYRPHGVLVTDKGIRSYVFRFAEMRWEDIRQIDEQARWVEFSLAQGPNEDIEYEDLLHPEPPLLYAIKNQSRIRQIPYAERRKEYY